MSEATEIVVSATSLISPCVALFILLQSVVHLSYTRGILSSMCFSSYSVISALSGRQQMIKDNIKRGFSLLPSLYCGMQLFTSFGASQEE